MSISSDIPISLPHSHSPPSTTPVLNFAPWEMKVYDTGPGITTPLPSVYTGHSCTHKGTDVNPPATHEWEYSSLHCQYQTHLDGYVRHTQDVANSVGVRRKRYIQNITNISMYQLHVHLHNTMTYIYMYTLCKIHIHVPWQLYPPHSILERTVKDTCTLVFYMCPHNVYIRKNG